MIRKPSHLFLYRKLKELDPFLDEIFTGFYKKLLQMEHLSRFFTSEDQIKNLITKQRKNIWDSLDDTEEELHKRCIRLAEFHIKTVGLPFADYMEAFSFLEDNAFKILHREGKVLEYFEIINDYFENVRQYSAEGYLKEFIKSILEYPEPKEEGFKPLLFHAEHFKRVLQFIESGDIDSIKERISGTCDLSKWLSSLEAKMMIPDVYILERLKKRHDEIHAIYESIRYYTQNGLYFQSYIELKTLLHNYYLFSKEINEAYSSFIQNKEEMFLDLIKKTEEKYITYFAFIENLSILIRLHGQEFKELTIMEFMKSIENAFAGKKHVSIVDDGIIGLVKDINHEEINSALENIKTIIKNVSDKNINVTVALWDMKDFFLKEPDLLGSLSAKTFKDIYRLIIDEVKGKEVYLVAEDETKEKVKNIARLEAQKNKYSEMVFEDGRLDIFFQPVSGLRTKKIYDVEALVRLKENGKYVSAYLFIDALYERKLISELDIKVLAKVLEYASRIKNITNKVFINVSPLSLKIPKYRESIEKTIKHLKGEGVAPYFEITEQALLDNTEIIKYLSFQHGIKFAVDDFGTGYSSLRTVAELAEAEAISHLKIDGSLTKKLLDSEEVYKIVKSTSQMAKSLGLKTVAEFVENERVLNTLIELEIDYGQGFYFSPALHIDELVEKYKQGS